MADSVRIDSWLWAARFFKTRSDASRAVDGGKIEVNGRRARKSKSVSIGDMVRVTRAPYEFVVEVQGLSEKRGPAKAARELYAETPASRERREKLREQLRAAPVHDFRWGKPSKKERRELRRFKRDT